MPYILIEEDKLASRLDNKIRVYELVHKFA